MEVVRVKMQNWTSIKADMICDALCYYNLLCVSKQGDATQCLEKEIIYIPVFFLFFFSFLIAVTTLQCNKMANI